MDNDSTSAGSESPWSEPRKASSGKTWIIAGFGLLVLILIGAAAGSAWQSSVHSSDTDAAESHTSTAVLLQDANDQGAIAAQLLQDYVATGDVTIIPDIQARATAAVESLTTAVSQGDNTSAGQIVIDGARLAEGAGQVIALRQGDNVEGAAAALEEITPVFQVFLTSLQGAIDQELADASALQSSADEASAISAWLLVVSGAVGTALALAAVTLVFRSMIRRRAPKATSSI